METIEVSTVLSVAGLITSVCGAWLAVRKINKDLRRERRIEAAAILQEAKEHTLSVETFLINKIDLANKDIVVLKENVEKDIIHLKETYNGEIKNLGQKIEELRSEIKNQHSQMVGLLSKMIDTKD